ncbi:2TM domain-containing protein [Joostella sp. CR20]|uniref:2TM domain-containing protein n=1 Tax=Joostella sp. CR20 TaxID=2804312 RepID=UPI00313CF69D
MELSENEKYQIAKKRVDNLKGFYWHLTIFIIINTYILVNSYISSTYNNHDFWNLGTFSTLFFWGIGLFFHAWGVFGTRFVFSRNWEEKQIKKYLEKEEQQQREWLKRNR